jgi:putative oxidoreductase
MTKWIYRLLEPDVSGLGADVGVLLLRVGIGTIMITHGWDKLVNFSTYEAHFLSFLGLGNSISLALSIFAELFCAVAIVVGLATRPAALILLINMYVAAFVALAGQPFGKREIAVVYAIVFAALMFLGSGRFSLDQILWRRKE